MLSKNTPERAAEGDRRAETRAAGRHTAGRTRRAPGQKLGVSEWRQVGGGGRIAVAILRQRLRAIREIMEQRMKQIDTHSWDADAETRRCALPCAQQIS